MKGIRIGELLIDQGVLTRRQVEHILIVQKHSSRPFGDLAERLYGVPPEAVTEAWVEQYVRTAGVTDLSTVEIEPAVAVLINRRQAWQFKVLPLGRTDGQLSIATDAENLVRAVNFAARSLREPAVFVLAESADLKAALMATYPVPTHIADYAASL